MPADPYGGLMSNTDVRDWARERGIDISARGRISDDIKARYDAEHAPPPEPAENPDTGGGDDYDSGVTSADFPPPVLVPEPEPEAAGKEVRPRKITGPPGRSLRDRLTGKTKTGKAAPKKKIPRVSIAGLIEDAWSQMAWAASPIPPMQRLLYAQAPFAGIALEGALAGTMVDRALQPIARAEDKAKAVGGLVMPPVALMAVLASAPVPRQLDSGEWMLPEPAVQYKGALLTLRWSLMLMAEAGSRHLGEYAAKAEATAERGRQADEFMAWILGRELPPEAAAPVREEEEAISRAQAMFRGGEDNG